MGHRITRAAAHLSVDEVKERMKMARGTWVRHHWWIIYTARVAPRKADEIALHTGVWPPPCIGSSPGTIA